MVSNDRPRSAGPKLSPSIAESAAAAAATREPGSTAAGGPPAARRTDAAAVQSASFVVGRYALVFRAQPGSVVLQVASDDGLGERSPLDAAALGAWADSARRLLSLEPASEPRGRAEFRAPFMMDAARRPLIALGCDVGDGTIAYHLHCRLGSDEVEVVAVDRDVVEAIVQAASGAAAVAAESAASSTP